MRVKNVRVKVITLMVFVTVLLLFSMTVSAVETMGVNIEENIVVADILTEEELALIQEQAVYTVACSEDFAPISYVNGEEIQGTAIDVLQIIGSVLDIEFEYVELSKVGSEYEEVDIYMTNPLEDSDLMVEKSQPYYDSAYMAVHHLDHSSDNALPVGILEYYELSTEEVQEMIQNVEVIEYKDFETMNAAYEAGEIQSMLLNSARYNAVKDDIEDKNCRVEVFAVSYEWCFYYSETFSKEHIEIIDKVIAEIDYHTIVYSILSNATYNQDEGSISAWAKENPIRIVQLLVVFVLITAGIVVVNMAILERKRKRELEKRLIQDELTGLATGHYFERELIRLLETYPERDYTIISFDVDNFKYINEIYGHAVGTEVIHHLGFYMKKNFDEMIIVARTSGDNFLLLIETQNMTTEKMTIAKTFFGKEFSKHHNGLERNYPFSFSVGYYHIVDKTLDTGYMINCARLARDIGKKTTGYTIHEFTPQMELERKNNNQIVASMDKGIKEREFVLYYQPKVDLQTGETIGAEALVRWIQDGQVISPAAFIPIFEKNGFITTLDYYVLRTVCNYIKENEDKDLPVISVNLSTVTMMKSRLVAHVVKIVKDSGIQPNQIDLEITESAFVDEFEGVVEKVEELRKAGFTFSMDDFGVGISTLSNLRSIPIDTLKIDRKFIVDSLKSEKGAIIVSHIVAMAKALNLETVAEGIETREQLEFFQNLKCDVGQGYYYSRPLPEMEFIELLERTRDSHL